VPDFEDEDHVKKVARLAPAEGLTIYHAALPDQRPQTIEWLIENLLPRRSVVILSGWSSVGKTHVINDLMCALALNEPFAGMEIMRRDCGALLCAAEGQDDVRPRWAVLKHAKVQPFLEQRGERLDSYFPVSWIEEVPRLSAPDAFERYSAAIMATQAKQRSWMRRPYDGLGLVAIDTMAAAADLTDDQHNSAGTNQAIFNMLHRLANAFDVCILVTDHLGKEASRGTRGSGAKEASADVVLRLTGTVNEDGVVSNTAMTLAKLRGGRLGMKLPFTLKEVRMPIIGGRRNDGVMIKWDLSGLGMQVAPQNKRHPLLMRAVDAAISENFQWVRLERNANFKATDSALVWEKFKLSAAPTAETGAVREESIRKSFNRAMKDSSLAGVIGQKTLPDKSVFVWRTDYKFPDSSKVSE
jgi:AAA domain